MHIVYVQHGEGSLETFRTGEGDWWVHFHFHVPSTIISTTSKQRFYTIIFYRIFTE